MSSLKFINLLLAACILIQGASLGMSIQNVANERIVIDETRQVLLRVRQANRISVLREDSRQSVSVGVGSKKVAVPSVLWEQDLGTLKNAENFFCVLNRMECKRSSPCFCSGQPFVNFYHDSELLLTLRVKHDENVEVIVPGGTHSYRTGASGLAGKFYLLLKEYYPSNTADVEIANALSVAMNSDVTPIPEEIQKDQKRRQADALNENVDAVKNLNVPIVAPLP